MAVLRHRAHVDDKGNKGKAASYGSWERVLPWLSAFLCDRVHDDGQDRSPGSL